ncbi:hypothetical protein BC829DRAFT_385071, partial [Chytridium lagenaria]
FTNFCFALTINLESFGSFASFLTTFKDSLPALASLHPILRSRIVSLPTPSTLPFVKPAFKLHLEEHAVSTVPLRVEARPSRSVKGVLEEELYVPIPVADGPLMRMVVMAPVVASPTKVDVVFTFTHAAMDGKAGVEVVKDWARLMALRLSNGPVVQYPSSIAVQTLKDGIIHNLVPQAARRTWISWFRFVSHILRTLLWIKINRPTMLKLRPESTPLTPRTRFIRVALSKSQTTALLSRAKSMGVSVTALIMSSVAVAVAPYTTRKMQNKPSSAVSSWKWWLWFPFSLFSVTSKKALPQPPSDTTPNLSPTTGRRLRARSVHILGGLAIDARPVLNIPSHINGSFNTGILVRQADTPFLPSTTSALGLFNATGAGAIMVASTLKQALSREGGMGYAWRYAGLLDNKPHPETLISTVTPVTHVASRPSLPMSYSLSNLGNVGMEEGWVSWIEDLWMVSTVQAVTSWGTLQVNAVTLKGSLKVVLASVEGCFDDKVVKEVARRFGLALCGVNVAVVA